MSQSESSQLYIFTVQQEYYLFASIDFIHISSLCTTEITARAKINMLFQIHVYIRLRVPSLILIRPHMWCFNDALYVTFDIWSALSSGCFIKRSAAKQSIRYFIDTEHKCFKVWCARREGKFTHDLIIWFFISLIIEHIQYTSNKHIRGQFETVRQNNKLNILL